MAAFCANSGDHASNAIASSPRVATTMEANIARAGTFLKRRGDCTASTPCNRGNH
jgi:hypothetical protein